VNSYTGSEAMPRKAIEIDDTYMYVAGYSGLSWRIEKRNLSDGALVASFGTDGVVTETPPSTSNNVAYSIAIDSASMYVAGFDSSHTGYFEWRIEKRNLSDGALVAGFGTAGVVTVSPSASSASAETVVLDPTFIYIAGYDSVPGNSEWRIEKRYK
jgi:hypothetical protein